MTVNLKIRNQILGIGFAAVAMNAFAASDKPSAAQLSALKKLAAQSVLHVEAALQKIDAAGPNADQSRMAKNVYLPAQSLLKEWGAFGLTDQIMFKYSACSNMLGDIQIYGRDAVSPPKYHLSTMAMQKMQHIKEDLMECRSLSAK